jgi:hypothetical protein
MFGKRIALLGRQAAPIEVPIAASARWLRVRISSENQRRTATVRTSPCFSTVARNSFTVLGGFFNPSRWCLAVMVTTQGGCYLDRVRNELVRLPGLDAVCGQVVRRKVADQMRSRTWAE